MILVRLFLLRKISSELFHAAHSPSEPLLPQEDQPYVYSELLKHKPCCILGTEGTRTNYVSTNLHKCTWCTTHAHFGVRASTVSNFRALNHTIGLPSFSLTTLKMKNISLICLIKLGLKCLLRKYSLTQVVAASE